MTKRLSLVLSFVIWGGWGYWGLVSDGLGLLLKKFGVGF